MGTIADLLTRQGDIAAQGYREGGKIASGLATTLGAIPGQVVAQVAAQKRQGVEDQLTAKQLEGAQLGVEKAKTDASERVKALADAKYIGQVMGQFVKPDGTFDEPKMLAMTAQHDPSLVPVVQQHITAAKEARAKLIQTQQGIETSALGAAEKAQKIREADTDYLAGRAQFVKDNSPPGQIDGTVLAFELARLHGEGVDTTPVTNALRSGVPANKVIDAAIRASESQRKLQDSEATAAGTAANLAADNTRADAALAETTRHNKAEEAKAAQGGGLTGNAAAERGDAVEIVKGLKDGTTSPNVLESARTTALGAAIQAEAHRQGVDTASMTRNWISTKKAIQSLNSTQQIRLTEGIDKASHSLDKIEELSAALTPLMSRYGIKALNKAQLALAKNGTYGKDAASIATRLETQIADVTAEIGTVIMGGGAPTDHGLELAGKNLSSDWTADVLRDAVKQVRYNLNLANNARNDLLREAGVDVKAAEKTLANGQVIQKQPDGSWKVIR